MRSHQSIAIVTLLSLLFAGHAVLVRADEPEFSHWPFDEAAYGSADADEVSAAPEDRHWLPRPHILPRLIDKDRSYVLGQNRTPILRYVANTPQRMANRFHSLWNRSVDMLKFGRGDQPSTPSRRSGRRPLFGRLFGGDGEKKKGPQTVEEWMEQDRITP